MIFIEDFCVVISYSKQYPPKHVKKNVNFTKNNLCAFSHVTMACDDGNADIVKRLEVQVKELRQVIEDNKDIIASELKSLKNEIESVRKENLEILKWKIKIKSLKSMLNRK